MIGNIAAEDTFRSPCDTDGDGDWDTIDPAYNVGGTGADPLTPGRRGGGRGDARLRAAPAGGQRPGDRARLRDPDREASRPRRERQRDRDGAARGGDRARLGGIKVDPRAWSSSRRCCQQGTLGFNLYETDDASLRGTLHPLNASFVASPFRDSLAPIAYRVETGPVTRRYLVFEELEAGGRHRLMGPFVVGDPELARAFDRTSQPPRARRRAGRSRAHAVQPLDGPPDARRAQRRGAPSRPFADPAAVRSRSGVKVEIAAAGPVEVPLTALREQGLVRPAGSSVWSQGQRGARRRAARARTARRRSSSRAGPSSTDYTGRNVYVVTAGAAGRSAARAAHALRVRRRARDACASRRARSTCRRPRSAATPGCGRTWSPSGASGRTRGGTRRRGLRHPRPARRASRGPVRVRVRLMGFSEDEHRITARLNGQPAGRGRVRGQGRARRSWARVLAETLLAAGNQL